MPNDTMGTSVAKSPQNGIFFVTDTGFLWPTLSCALEVRSKVPSHHSNIHIVTVGMGPEILNPLRGWLEPLGVQINILPDSFLKSINLGDFNKTHVPLSTLGRLFMLECVPQSYKKILYLDGDVWPLGDPTALLDAFIPDGCFAAAEDRSFYWRTEAGSAGKAIRAYHAALGIDGDAGYFNAGVLFASATTWKDLSTDAFRFFMENAKICRYHDQSALNAVAGTRRIRLNPKWNYIYDYYDWEIKPAEPPQIVHFCGPIKPWTINTHPFFSVFQPVLSSLEQIGLSSLVNQNSQAQALLKASRLAAIKSTVILNYRNRIRRRMFKDVVATSTLG